MSAPPHESAEARGGGAKDLAAALRLEGTQLMIYEASAGPWNVTGYLRAACTTLQSPLVIMLPSTEASAELLYLLFADEFYHAGIACMCVDVAPRTGLQSTALPGQYLRGGLVRQLLDVAAKMIDLDVNGATLIDLSTAADTAIIPISQDPRVSQWVSASAIFPWAQSVPAPSPPSLVVPQMHIYRGRDDDNPLLAMSKTKSTWSNPRRCDWSELPRQIAAWVLTTRADAVLIGAGC
jgi:hypothetical protein